MRDDLLLRQELDKALAAIEARDRTINDLNYEIANLKRELMRLQEGPA